MRNYNWILIVASVAVHVAVIGSLQLNVGSFTPAHSSVMLQLQQPQDLPQQVLPETKLEPAIIPVQTPVAKPVIQPKLVPTKPTPVAQPVATPVAQVSTMDTGNVELTASTLELEAVTVPVQAPPTAPVLPPTPAPAPEPPPSIPSATPAVDVTELLRSYAGSVKREIMAAKLYPSAAERLGHEGVVQVSFVVAKNGMLLSVKLKTSSGYSSIDEAAIGAVQAASPFKAIPVDSGRDSLPMSISLKYYLE